MNTGSDIQLHVSHSETSLSSVTSSIASFTAPSWGRLGSLSKHQTCALAEFWLRLLTLFESTTTTTTCTNSSQNTSLSTNTTVNTATISPQSQHHPITVWELRKEFWLACQDQSPDAFLLRFLRARKFDVSKAYTMLLTTLKWRILTNVNDIISYGEINIDSYQFTCGKSYFYNIDRLGRPVIYINARYHEKNKQSEDMLQRHTIYLMEAGRLLLTPGSETVTIIFNLINFGMSNMDNNMVKFLVNCLQNYYPESLGLCAIVNAPWIFSGVWKLIKPWLDPVVQAKVIFAKPNDLLQYIDKENLPAEIFSENPNEPDTSLGKYIFKYPPPTMEEISKHKLSLDNVTLRNQLELSHLNAVQPYEQLSRKWATLWLNEFNPNLLNTLLNIDGNNSTMNHNNHNNHNDDDNLGDRDMIITQRDELIQSTLKTTWWELDDYIRFETLFHRMGVIKRGGGGADWTKCKQV